MTGTDRHRPLVSCTSILREPSGLAWPVKNLDRHVAGSHLCVLIPVGVYPVHGGLMPVRLGCLAI
jgi:hypothetical protein